MTGCIGHVWFMFPHAVFVCCVFCNIWSLGFDRILSGHVGAVAPVLPVWELLQLVLLVLNLIFIILGHFAGVLCFA